MTHVIPARRTAIVTGGSRGIGRRLAERLAEAGHAVVVGYAHAAAEADAVVAGIREAGGKAVAVQADVADETAARALFDAAEAAFGGVDLVVNGAGVLTARPLVDLSLDEIDAMLRTNLRGAIVVGREAARRIRPGGALITLSSAITRNLAPGYGVYAATKAGLEALTVVLARELAGRDITVNAVAPGPTDTDMLAADLTGGGDPDAARQAIVGMTPLGRIGRPDDIAEVVLALAGPVRWIHGQVIHVSGGIA